MTEVTAFLGNVVLIMKAAIKKRLFVALLFTNMLNLNLLAYSRACAQL